ncbi:hypothetical protein [Streptomyces sp. NPDC002088]
MSEQEAATVGAKDDCPAVLLRPTDREGARAAYGSAQAVLPRWL